MKRTLLILLLAPWVLLAQEGLQEPVFMNVMLTPNPAKISEFEAGLAAHNKKFHAEGSGTVNVFWIASGKNSGKYIWSMGPTSWAAFDETNTPDSEHTTDWNTNVAPYAEATMETTYWKNDLKHSNFSRDFTLKNLAIFIIDMKRFKQLEFEAVLDKVQEVYKAKDPDHQWGSYFNEMPNNEGQDYVWVDFFDSSAWMGKPDNFPQWFEEVHGEGSFAKFLKEVDACTHGESSELWMFREDLSGGDGNVQALVAGGQ